MSYSRKERRTMFRPQMMPHLLKIQLIRRKIKETQATQAHNLIQDPVDFFHRVLGFTPTDYQKELIQIFLKNQFIAARWCRQSGKSHIVSALLLWYALTHPNSHIGIVGPSLRQAKLIIRRITQFTRKLREGTCTKPLRTIVCLNNGSTIEAFPNSPETIRGPSLHVVYCDEMNFLPNDQEMYDAILFTLGTTNGKFICTSTPWSTDSLFHKINNHQDYADYAKHHITWQQAVEPQGPLKRNILEKIKKQLVGDPWRWKREMEAEWAEDETVWLTQSLITRCIDGTLEPLQFDSTQEGQFYAGLDLGKHRDHSALIIIEDFEGTHLLRHWKVFPLETKYATVIGYIKSLTDRWHTLNRIEVDVTGIGEYIVEDMKNANIDNVEPVTFTATRKQELATFMKQQMTDGTYRFPFIEPRISPTVKLSYVAELNVERYHLRKDGTIGYSHPQGTHDDTFWATALAIHSTQTATTEPTLTVTQT